MTDTVEVTTGTGEPTASVIWLHGLGADGHDFEPIVPELRLDAHAIRFVFPHAPVRPVTINGGMQMRAWFDILSFDKSGRQDEDGVRESSDILDALIEREIDRGIDPSRIVVAGFSQGGAVVLYGAMRRQQALAGVMALSTFMPSVAPFTDDLSSAVADRSTPVFVAHGTFDPVLPLALGQDVATQLEAAGFSPEWHDYPMAHAVCPQEIQAIRDWLLRVLAD